MTKITGASFTNCTIGGRPMNSGDTPFVGRNGNIAWPDGCTREQRRDWRMMADEPGHEWPGAAAEEPPFDAFDRFLAAVASDDPEFRAREARRAASRERRPGIPTRTVAAGLILAGLVLLALAIGMARAAEPCAIKGNVSRSGARIYHLPGMATYGSVLIDPDKGERMFCSEDEAVRAGWRPAKGRAAPERSESVGNPFR